ncbi:hypothetical protein JMJ35_000978 [Cladonia borealis]|uniref:Uncharacterized protein n=1 Tax=Cladonia borealis TaxID=184061 RepID=A0AA39V9S2_9LECA|nr:hypothetical protein JMJ35_000978 [Cladonia borealis]
MTLTVPALPLNIIRLRTPPISERSNDGSSVMGPKVYPESEPAVPAAGTADATESLDQATLVAPDKAFDAKGAVKIVTPSAPLTTQNLAKYQDTIGSAMEQELLQAINRYPTPAKSPAEQLEAPKRPTKQAPAAGHVLPAIPMSFDGLTMKRARKLPPETMRSPDVTQGVRERKLGMGGGYLLPGEMKKSNTARNLEPLEQAPGSHTTHRRNEEQLMLAETPYLQAALSRQIDMDLASDDEHDGEQGTLSETIPATIQFALPTPTPEELSKAQVYYQNLNLKAIDDSFLPTRVASKKRQASDRSDVRQSVGKRRRREGNDDEGYRVNGSGRATEEDSIIVPKPSPDNATVSFIPEMSGALQDVEVSQGEVWQSM